MTDLPIYKFKIFEKFDDEIIHGVSMREGGISKGPFESLNLGLQIGDETDALDENYKRFCDVVNVDRDYLCVAYQAHTDKINLIKDRKKRGTEDLFMGSDGFITNIPAVPIMVRFADCQGVFLYDPVNRVIGAVHSGWRGNVKNIIGNAVRIMKDDYGSDPSEIIVGITPSLGPCCGEFTDPYSELPEVMHKYVSGSNVNLWECSLNQLMDEGILRENIELAGRCTVCENDKFFSYRGGKRESGHMGGVIQLKKFKN